MVLQQANQSRAMATKTPIRTAPSPSYAVSMSVVPSHSPVVVRRALKTRTDEVKVMFLKTQDCIFNVFSSRNGTRLLKCYVTNTQCLIVVSLAVYRRDKYIN